MSDVLYRVARPDSDGSWEPVTLSYLVRCKRHRVRVGRPRHPRLPEGEWYCDNSDCVVRYFTVDSKLFGDDVLPAMKCPGCTQLARFQTWIEWETLVPVEQGDDVKDN